MSSCAMYGQPVEGDFGQLVCTGLLNVEEDVDLPDLLFPPASLARR